MTELITQIRVRALDAITSLEAAQADDDPHLESVRVGELESLARTAAAHDLDVPELAPFAGPA